MGETSVILEGVESRLNSHTLNSTVHGAGRVMGRMEAKGKFRNGVCIRKGRVTPEMMNGWLKSGRVVLRGGGLDESPDCYKRLTDVLAEHGDSIRILHILTPMGVAMAGANEFDPYKD
jgi:tRNA-splicing ligase RtcB